MFSRHASPRRAGAAAALALAACACCAHAAPAGLPASGFLRIALPGGPGGAVEIAGVTREVLHRPATSPPRSVPVDETGQVTLHADAWPALAAGATGLRISLRFSDPSPLRRTKRTAYEYLSATELAGGPRRFLPPGVPAPTASVETREVFPVGQHWTSDPVVLPEGAHLSWAVGLQADWRVSGRAGASFTLALEQGGRWHLLDQVTHRLDARATDSDPGWLPREASLAQFAGAEARFHFISRPVDGAPDPQFAHPLWSVPLLRAAAAPDAARPNVIFICLDTVRRDRLGLYGYPRGTSPHLDAFAEDAQIFDQAIAPAPWTTPTHASIFTGYHPDVHRAGVLSAGYHLQPGWSTLAEHMRLGGRLTAAHTEGIAIRGQMGFAQGFDLYSDGPSPDRHIKGRAPMTFAAALDWLRAHGDAPFFLFVQTYEAHEPYGAPEAHARRFIRGDLPLQETMLGADAHTGEERQRVSDLYDAGIAYTDEQLGVFLAGLRELNLMENTIVVIFSDHGEEFWEHGAVGHTTHVHDEVLRVPLVVRVPGQPGGRIAQQADLTDLFATALEWIGQKPPEDSDSVSLMPLLEQRTGYARERVVSVLVNNTPDLLDAQGLPVEWRRVSQREPGWKYIRSDREVAEGGEVREMLFDLGQDPGEEADRAGDLPEARAAQRARLEQFEAEKAAVRARHGVEGGAGLSGADIDALQSLGYL